MQIYLGLVFNPVQRVENAWKMLAPKHTEYFHHVRLFFHENSLTKSDWYLNEPTIQLRTLQEKG